MSGDSAYDNVLLRLVNIYLLENRECKSVVLARLVPMSSLGSLRNAQLSLPSYANNSISALATIAEDVSSISIIAMFITPEYMHLGFLIPRCRNAGTRNATQRLFQIQVRVRVQE